VHIKITGIW